jgi:hypothetical protein
LTLGGAPLPWALDSGCCGAAAPLDTCRGAFLCAAINGHAALPESLPSSPAAPPPGLWPAPVARASGWV